MPDSDQASNDGNAPSSSTKPVRPRVWRACEVCRKRKIKCDGQDPCSFCTTNKKDCSFTTIHDNASYARRHANDTQTRLEKLEEGLGRLLPMTEAIHGWFAGQNGILGAGGGGGAGMGMGMGMAQGMGMQQGMGMGQQQAQVGQGMGAQSQQTSPVSFPQTGYQPQPLQQMIQPPQLYPQPTQTPTNHSHNQMLPPQTPQISQQGQAEGSRSGQKEYEMGIMNGSGSTGGGAGIGIGGEGGGNGDGEGEEEEDEGGEGEGADTWADKLAGTMMKDSMGNMRYLGGASTFVLSEAINSLSHPPASSSTPSSSSSRPQAQRSQASLDHLYFRPNAAYRPLSGLPTPESVLYPPAELAEALVQMYFWRIHHTFPIIDKPAFLLKYKETMALLKRGTPSKDSSFLSVLFAVFASAASLTKKHMADNVEFKFSSPTEYVGLEFYERALYLYWVDSRLVTIDHVTCMALLSACLAGWNTLSQSWITAGNAVRGAQDLGLHRSPRRLKMSPAAKEHRRRVWWCVYGLDKILSVSMGRPSGTFDDDCDVEFPSQDYLIEGNDTPSPSVDDSMVGFTCLLRIYQIAGKIERQAHSIAFLKMYNNSPGEVKVQETINSLDAELGNWSETLPDSVRFAANDLGRPHMLSLCLLSHFILYASLLNLHRPFMPDGVSSTPSNFVSLSKCISAAKGCIRIGELVKELLPTSHHCQFCVQYLTISGIILLRCITYMQGQELIQQLMDQAMQCRRLLSDLEDTWPGSKRCGLVIQELLGVCQSKMAMDMAAAAGAASTNGRAIQPSPVAQSTSSSTANGKKRRVESESNQFDEQSQLRAKSGPGNNGFTAPKDPQEILQNVRQLQPPTPGNRSDILQNMPYASPANPFMAELQSGEGGSVPNTNWAEFATPFDYSFLTNEAPFDLSQDIGAFLENIRDPPDVETVLHQANDQQAQQLWQTFGAELFPDHDFQVQGQQQ